MEYEKMSNEKLDQFILEMFSGRYFKEVTDDNRETAIAFLTFLEDEEEG
jgi:hypothetical protein